MKQSKPTGLEDTKYASTVIMKWGTALTKGGVNMFLIKKYAEERKNAPALSQTQIRAEANLGLQLESFVSAWSSLAKDCRNKTEWNNFAKYVLNEVEAIDKTIKEVKK